MVPTADTGMSSHRLQPAVCGLPTDHNCVWPVLAYTYIHNYIFFMPYKSTPYGLKMYLHVYNYILCIPW